MRKFAQDYRAGIICVAQDLVLRISGAISDAQENDTLEYCDILAETITVADSDAIASLTDIVSEYEKKLTIFKNTLYNGLAHNLELVPDYERDQKLKAYCEAYALFVSPMPYDKALQILDMLLSNSDDTTTYYHTMRHIETLARNV